MNRWHQCNLDLWFYSLGQYGVLFLAYTGKQYFCYQSLFFSPVECHVHFLIWPNGAGKINYSFLTHFWHSSEPYWHRIYYVLISIHVQFFCSFKHKHFSPFQSLSPLLYPFLRLDRFFVISSAPLWNWYKNFCSSHWSLSINLMEYVCKL
jgi:hypothetical protein